MRRGKLLRVPPSINEPLGSAKSDFFLYTTEFRLSTVDPALMPFQANYPGNLNSLTEIDYTTLDDINNDVPILLLSASMPTVYVNSVALKIVFDKSKSVEEQYKDFETYRQKTNGQLQEEEQISQAFKSIPISQWLEIFDHIFRNLNAFFETAVSRGVTFMYDAGMNEVGKSLLDTYLLYHQSKVRIRGKGRNAGFMQIMPG